LSAYPNRPNQLLWPIQPPIQWVSRALPRKQRSKDVDAAPCHHHHNISVMELGHLLNRSGLTHPEVSSKFYHDSFCHLESCVSLPWVIYFEAFYLHVVSSFSCIPVICPKLMSFLTPLQFVHLFCNLSKCILLFFSCISSVLLLFFWRPLL